MVSYGVDYVFILSQMLEWLVVSGWWLVKTSKTRACYHP